MTADQASVREWLQLIRAEYEELPNLRRTQSQAESLWGLDSTTAEALLAAPVFAGILRRTRGV